MLLLTQDVRPDRILPGLTHAKSSVARLPRECSVLRPSLMHPTRRVGLDQAGEVRHGMRRGHSNEQMNVIGHAIDAKCNPAEFADDAAEIRVQIGLNLY